jgi:hypothetical protein
VEVPPGQRRSGQAGTESCGRRGDRKVRTNPQSLERLFKLYDDKSLNEADKGAVVELIRGDLPEMDAEFLKTIQPGEAHINTLKKWFARRRPGIFLPASAPSSSTGRWTRRASGAVTRIDPRLRGVTAVGIRLTQPVPSRSRTPESLARSSLKAGIKRNQEQGWIE